MHSLHHLAPRVCVGDGRGLVEHGVELLGRRGPSRSRRTPERVGQRHGLHAQGGRWAPKSVEGEGGSLPSRSRRSSPGRSVRLTGMPASRSCAAMASVVLRAPVVVEADQLRGLGNRPCRPLEQREAPLFGIRKSGPNADIRVFPGGSDRRGRFSRHPCRARHSRDRAARRCARRSRQARGPHSRVGPRRSRNPVHLGERRLVSQSMVLAGNGFGLDPADGPRRSPTYSPTVSLRSCRFRPPRGRRDAAAPSVP